MGRPQACSRGATGHPPTLKRALNGVVTKSVILTKGSPLKANKLLVKQPNNKVTYSPKVKATNATLDFKCLRNQFRLTGEEISARILYK